MAGYPVGGTVWGGEANPVAPGRYRYDFYEVSRLS